LSTLDASVSPDSGSTEVALMAETDANPRGVLGRALRASGYEVVAATNPEQLEAALRSPWLLEAPNPVAVLGVGFAKRCAGALAVAAARRARAGLKEISVVLIYEQETLTSVVRPSLGPCNLVAIFEKPVDFEQLSSVVRATSLVHQARSSPER
jgi:DNA-binding NtrC family response regulator